MNALKKYYWFIIFNKNSCKATSSKEKSSEVKLTSELFFTAFVDYSDKCLAAVVFSVRSYLSVRFGVSADLIFCEAWKDFFVFSVVRWKKQALLQTLACVSPCAVCKCACF
jgi:hypothetical protein